MWLSTWQWECSHKRVLGLAYFSILYYVPIIWHKQIWLVALFLRATTTNITVTHSTCKLAFCVTTKVFEQICNQELGSTLTFKSFLDLEAGIETVRSILYRNKSILKSRAVRDKLILMFLKKLQPLIMGLINGRSETWIIVTKCSSSSNHTWSNGFCVIHFRIYCGLLAR